MNDAIPVQPDVRQRRLETVTALRPRCPGCGGTALTKYRSLRDDGDGTALSWVRCLDPDCGQHFRVRWQ